MTFENFIQSAVPALIGAVGTGIVYLFNLSARVKALEQHRSDNADLIKELRLLLNDINQRLARIEGELKSREH